MCLTKTQDMPLNPGIIPDPNNSGVGPIATTPPPSTVPVRMPTKMGRVAEVASGGMYDPTGGLDTTNPPAGGPTKFGALIKILAPAMHGAAIGGFLGKSTPGGGFAAVNNYYLQQRMRQMQMAEFMQHMALNQSTIAKNQAEAAWAQRRPLVTRTGPAIKGKDAQGNDIYLTQNPTTGEYEKQEGVTPAPGPVKEVPTDQGLVTYDPTNPQKGAVPLTLAQQAASVTREGSAESASEPSKRATIPGGVPPGMFKGTEAGTPAPSTLSGKPRVPGTGSPAASPAATAIPLHGPNFRTPKPAIRASRDVAGNETDNIIDENPNSKTFGKTIKKTGVTRAPLPLSKTEAAKTESTSEVETYAAEALKRSGNDPDKAIQFMNGLKVGDPDAQKKLQSLLPKIRQSIRDRMKPTKKRLTLSPEEQKAAGLSPTATSSVVPEEEEQNP